MKHWLLSLSLLAGFVATAQRPGYWQQKADYKIEVDMDVQTFRYSGKQEIIYTNNSPDTLSRVFIHLYNNAFQPNSEMDYRLSTIKDPDRRMMTTIKNEQGEEIKVSKISQLKPNQIGYLRLKNITSNGVATTNLDHQTIYEIKLPTPLYPNAQTTLKFDFDGQVPEQIRRNGRNSSEGVDLSMAQWYPRMVEYDVDGWNAAPYIAREFHGVWGNFDVKISIDKNYVLGGTGYLQNPNEIGHGYQEQGVIVKHPKKTKKLTWHFLAPNVHDFTWAADPDYIHDIYPGPNGLTLHFLYLPTSDKPNKIENWKNLQPATAKMFEVMNEVVGEYPYKQYSVIQGGDGGMEYGMCTLILGNGTWEGLAGVTAHEMVHSWFQFILATNESKYYWMDEGFTSYYNDILDHMIAKDKDYDPHSASYNSYVNLAKSGKELPLTTHADRHELNQAYGISAYSKGSVFLAQLGYVIGEDNLQKTIKRFYKEWKFKHPTPEDFIRIAEKVSGMHLEWYLNDFTRTTNKIDYAIKDVQVGQSTTKITLERKELMPMPIDVIVRLEDGSLQTFYIPLRMAYGQKDNPYPHLSREVLSDWSWAQPTYTFEVNGKVDVVVIDPSQRLADINAEDNSWEKK